jgi:hypothetical protein
MSTVPPLTGPPLYRYIPGVGKVASSINGPTGPAGPPGTASGTGSTGNTGPAGFQSFSGPTGSVLFFNGVGVTGRSDFSLTGTTLQIPGNMIPSASNIYSLGVTGARWKELLIGPGSINIQGPLGFTGTATIGTDANGIVYTESGIAAPFFNIGPGQLTPLATGGWRIGPTGTQGTSSYDLVAQEKVAGGVSLTGPVYSLIRSPTETCASAYSDTDQTMVSGTAANIAHTDVSLSYGITVTTGANSYFQVPSAGIYKIIPSIQYLGDANETLIIWIKVNGTNVADTGTLTKIKNQEEGIITCEYLLDLSANAQVQVWGLAQGHNGIINYIAGGGSGANIYPASPGVITNMYRIR